MSEAANPLYDTLTGLSGRAQYDLQLVRAVENARQNNQTLSLLVLDLDYFKSINDGFGHARGDQVLTEFGLRLRNAIRGQDHAFRYGGDEFVVLLPNTEKGQAIVTAQRLLALLIGKVYEGDPPLTISMSIGVACFPQDALNAVDLFHIADQRSLQAKRNGRGQVLSETQLETRPVSPDSRLIERDLELELLNRFLDGLPHLARAALRVGGLPGCGQARMLDTAAKAAGQRGFNVLMIHGTPVLRARVYGALSEALPTDLPLPLSAQDDERLVNEIKKRIQAQSQRGLFLSLNNWNAIDQDSRRVIRSLFFNLAPFPVGLAYGDTSGNSIPFMQQGAGNLTSLELRPLSKIGVQIWLRHTLQWEAPPEFIEWLYQETEGRPAWLARGLRLLTNHGVLLQHSTGWSFRSDFSSLPLRADLQQPLQRAHTLVAGQPDFVGREDEIRGLKRLLRQHRLVMLLGPGGVGKTRLALQAAAESELAFEDGVFYAGLEALASADFLAPAVARSIGLVLSGEQNPQTQLLTYLSGRRVLLVLDNFETLRAGAPFIQELLVQAPGVSILVVSREHLHLPEAQVLELSELPYPPQDDAPDLERYASARLFLLAARRARPDFTLTSNDYAAVARICRQAGGLPLGLELAAAWVHLMSCQEIAERLEQSQSFLDTRPDQGGGGKTNESSFSAVFDSLWQAFDPDEQARFARLSIFRGGFSVQAARTVADIYPFFLDGLESKLYIRRHGNGRYQIPELLRQFTAHRLTEQQARQSQALGQHAYYYLKLLADEEHRLRSDPQALLALQQDLDNIRQAWQHALQQHDLAQLHQAAAGLTALYFQSGLFEEAVNALQTSLHNLQSSRRAAWQKRPEYLPLLARLYNKLGRMQFIMSSYDKSLKSAQHAIQVAQQAGDIPLEIEAELICGGNFISLGEISAAKTHLQRAGAMLEGRDDLPYLKLNYLRALGTNAFYENDFVTARSYDEAGLALARQLNDRLSEAGMLNNLGSNAFYQDQFEEAVRHYRQALEIGRAMNDRWTQVSLLGNLGVIHLSTGEYLPALRSLNEGLALSQAVNDLSSQANILNDLALCMIRLGDYPAAEQYLEQALKIGRSTDESVNECWSLVHLSHLACLTDSPQQGLEFGQRALETVQNLEMRMEHAAAQQACGESLMKLGRLDEAEYAYTQAMAVRLEIGQMISARESQAGLTRVALLRGDLERARSLAYKILQDLPEERLEMGLEPLRLYWTCYQALHAAKDPQAARALALAQGYLYRQAGRLEDPALRRSYLENISLHRQISAAAPSR
jgi:diguanylate cyclase (GGDEF)-like protein